MDKPSEMFELAKSVVLARLEPAPVEVKVSAKSGDTYISCEQMDFRCVISDVRGRVEITRVVEGAAPRQVWVQEFTDIFGIWGALFPSK